MKFTVESEIFDAFPGLKIIVVVAKNIHNDLVKPEIMEELSNAWKSAGAAAIEYGNPQSHPRVKVWVDHFKKLGVSRKKFPSSIEALIKRASKSDVPIAINPMVDFYNAISLKHIVTAGAYDIDQFRHGLTLRFSKIGDSFQALDDPEPVQIPVGEVSYADGSEIVTRHFIWRQSKIGLVRPESKNVLLLSEIPGALGEDLYKDVKGALISGVKYYFETDPKDFTVDADNIEIEV